MIHKHFQFQGMPMDGMNQPFLFTIQFDIDEQTGEPSNLQTEGLHEPMAYDGDDEFAHIHRDDEGDWCVSYNLARLEDREWGDVGFRIVTYANGDVLFILKGVAEVDDPDDQLNIIEDVDVDEYEVMIGNHLRYFRPDDEDEPHQ